MKNLLKIALLSVAVGVLNLNAQTTNEPPVIQSPIWDFLTQGSNYIVATYGIADTTSHDFGAGIGVGYKLNEFVVPTLRLDYINGRVWMPSGSLQIQAPVKLFGKLEVIPFAFGGIASAVTGKHNENGDLVTIGGIGAAFRLPKSDKWYIPTGLLGDYEVWNGGGFSDNQIRFGIYKSL